MSTTAEALESVKTKAIDRLEEKVDLLQHDVGEVKPILAVVDTQVKDLSEEFKEHKKGLDLFKDEFTKKLLEIAIDVGQIKERDEEFSRQLDHSVKVTEMLEQKTSSLLKLDQNMETMKKDMLRDVEKAVDKFIHFSKEYQGEIEAIHKTQKAIFARFDKMTQIVDNIVKDVQTLKSAPAVAALGWQKKAFEIGFAIIVTAVVTFLISQFAPFLK
jgi:chromosome segregation ATPase